MKTPPNPRLGIANDEPELIIDGELKSPKPLDRRIATLLLRSPSNNPTEGYDLHLSATFGRERVILSGGEFEIDVDFSVKTADIELQFVRCTYSVINTEDSATTAQAKTTITQRSGLETKLARKAGATGSLTLDATPRGEARAGASYERALTTTATTERSVTQRDWRRLGGDTLQVGPVGNMLDGELVTDLAGWRVTPTVRDQPSGVIARINVRENWINFDDVKMKKWPGALMQKVKELFLPERWQRKEYFQLLLQHLTQTGLRDHQNGKDATIAAHAIIVRPSEDRVDSLYAGENRREIAIDGDRVAKFLAAEEGHEAGALIALGLRRDIITPVAEKDAKRPATRGTVFIPEGSPLSALALFKTIHSKMGGAPLTKASLQLPRRAALKDLRALNLVARGRPKTITLMVNPGINPEAFFRRAVSDTPCMNVARAVLRINPDATPTDIADAVALELGKDWPTVGTKKRNGNMIIRWAVWLEPHLLYTASNSQAAARVAYATNLTGGKGRPSLRKSAEAEVRKLYADNVPVSEIAERFNVATVTIYDWLKQLGLRD